MQLSELINQHIQSNFLVKWNDTNLSTLFQDAIMWDDWNSNRGDKLKPLIIF